MKHLKSILFYLTLGLIVFSAGVATYVYFNADAIKERAVRGLNAVVVSKIEVGKVSLSLFKRFPNTTLVLEHVTINDPVQNERYLCKDATVFLDFNSLDLLFGNYNLNHIGLQADFVRLVKHPAKWNYILWEPDSTSNSKDVNINLRSFDWRIDSLYLKVDGLYAESKTTGKLSFENGLLSTDADLGFARVFYDKKKYHLPSSEVHLESFNPNNQQFAQAHISNQYLQAKAIHVNGSTYQLAGTCLQLKPLAESLEQQNVPNLLGKISFQFLLSTEAFSEPKNLEFDVQNLQWKEQNISRLSGKVNMPNSSNLDLAKFNLSGIYNGFDVALSSTDEGTNRGAQVLNLKAVNAALPLSNSSVSLIAELIEAKISLPKLSKLNENFDIQTLNFLSGKLVGVHYKMNALNQDLELKGNADIMDNSLVFKSQEAFLNSKPIEVKAVIPAIKPLLEETPKLLLQLEASSPWLMLAPLNEGQQNTKNSADTLTDDPALDYSIELVFDAEKLSYDKIASSNTFGSLVIRPGGIDISSFSANAFDGKMFAKGYFSSRTEKLSITGFANNFSAEKVLKTFDNFHQEYVSYTNCKGSVDVNFELEDVAFWNNDWGFSKYTVHMYNAELQNLPFLNDIKSAVKQNKFAKIILNEEELFEKLSFINLQEAKANVVLQKQTVFVNDAIFRSPEINLNSAGEYNVATEQVDFEFQLYLRDFFAKSANQNHYYEPETKGSKLKFYLRGDADNPDVGMLKRDKNTEAAKRPSFKPEKDIDSEPEGGTIFVIEEEKNPKEISPTKEIKEAKKKSGWLKKMLEKGGSLQDTSKVEFGIE